MNRGEVGEPVMLVEKFKDSDIAGQDDTSSTKLLTQDLGTATMKSLSFLLSVAACLASASAVAIEHNAVAPVDALSPRGGHGQDHGAGHGKPQPPKDNWGNAVEKDRKKITIRASKHDRDDISDDFLAAIKKANHGGLLHLQKGKKYVIGKKLDLSFLKDVYVKIDGELKVSTLLFTFIGEIKQLIALVHRRHHVLASQQLLLPLPEEHHLLGLGRQVS